MNKKRLSVVMAGAMLASSVAPVLAATESELDTSKLGNLVEKVKEQLIGTRFTKDTTKLLNKDLAGQSVYYVVVTKDGVKTTLNLGAKTVEGQEEALRKELQEAFKNLTAEDKVEIYSHGFKTEGKEIVDCTTSDAYKYSKEDFKHETPITNGWTNKTVDAIRSILAEGSHNIITMDSHVRVVDNEIRIYFYKKTMASLDETIYKPAEGYFKLLTIHEGDNLYDFSKVILTDGTEMTLDEAKKENKLGNVKTFAHPSEIKKDIDKELIETVKITGTVHNYKTEDLYDRLMLTTAGHDLLSAIKEVTRDGKSNTTVTFKTLRGEEFDKADGVVKGSTAYDTKVELPKVDSEYGFVVTITDAFGKTTKYTVKGAEKQTNVVATWLYSELARVDILAGANRYETAVAIAKEQALVGKGHLGESNGNPKSNIVLVNGNSLVDGLSAAPLASVLEAGDAAAPVLLTEADELPRATKLYLKELLDKKIVGDLDTKIHLVGGTTVLSRSLEKELENMGFKVVRYNGDNREETSLKVAKKIEKLGGVKDKAFVVGAEGEADAMSISGYASTESIPVIVSKKGGLTYDGLKELEDKAVTVLGGENSVSAKEFEAIKEEADAVRRISGANRQATNAAIIREFYHGEYLGTIDGVKEVKSVIVAKDGRANKTQLVDALTAANLAAQFNAPVVLATEKLSDEQVEALQLRAKSSKSLYQVGHGVERSVVETIASKLGLLNK